MNAMIVEAHEWLEEDPEHTVTIRSTLGMVYSAVRFTVVPGVAPDWFPYLRLTYVASPWRRILITLDAVGAIALNIDPPTLEGDQ